MAKRERCINWEKEEKALLREILKSFVHVIENKDISTNTNKSKINAWMEITEQFNRANKRLRDKKQLMNQWKLMKLKSKKEISIYKQQTRQTGGGPKPPSPAPDVIDVVEMIPQEFVVNYNKFDCDGIKPIIIEKMSEPAVVAEVPIVESHLASTSQPVLPIKESLTAQLTPKCSAKKRMLSDNKFNFAEASYEDMHRFRMIENERQNVEHEARMQIHSQVMTNLKLQEELFRKMLENCSKN